MAVAKQSALWAARKRLSILKGALKKFEDKVATEREERLATIEKVRAEVVFLEELESAGVKTAEIDNWYVKTGNHWTPASAITGDDQR